MNNYDTTGEDRLRLLEAQVLYFYKELEEMFMTGPYEDMVATYRIMEKYRTHFGIYIPKIVE